MNIVDKRGTLASHSTKTYRRRVRSQIQNIAVHHSATTSGSAESFARYHVHTLGWPGIGYHYVVDKDGTIHHCHDLEVVSYHVGNSNGRAIGICMVGDFRTQSLAAPQRDATIQLVQHLLTTLNLQIEDVWGHMEFPGYAWKPCPSINMDQFRASLSSSSIQPEPPRAPAPQQPSTPTSRTILSRGDIGEDVREIQRRLNELGFHAGAADGIFGPLTLDAVQRFQRAARITVDGVVGPQTRNALSNFNQSVEIIEHASPTDEPDQREEEIARETRRMLRLVSPMMRGEDVREVQQKVGAIPDGIFGQETFRKVMQFQQQNSLVADGIVGPITWRALDRVRQNRPAYQRLLSLQRPNMTGEDVRHVQRALNISADGIFGPNTKRAVEQFQRREGITVDGIVGPQTWNRLF